VPVAAPVAPGTEVVAAAAAPVETRIAIVPAALAVNQPGPAPLAPPALKSPPSMPSLPNLPAPASYPKLASPLQGSDVTPCGQVWSGSEWISLECLDQTISGHPIHPSTVVIAYDKMRAPIEQLPKVVDHRADGTEGPVRKQQGTLCTAFAFTSALDPAYARWTGTPGFFSVMQVWGRYHSHQEHRAAGYNVGDYIGNEADWPFDGPTATKWRYCHPGDKKEKTPGVDCAVPVDEARLQQMEQRPVAVITKVELVPVTEFGVLREKLAAGQDVSVSVKMPSFATAGEPGSKYVVGVPPSDPTKIGRAEHQILLAGYAMTPNGTYYLVHNSFGTKWGDNGFAWLHEDFLKAFWSDNMMVIPYVEPVQVTTVRADPRGGLSRACTGGLVPDSISGLCSARCSDGSPRHNDVCARAGDCPKGQVNLTGECQLAAPTGSGSDPASRVSWACGPGGCSYSMPTGVLNCSQGECAVSCPAPDFRLATTPKGFGCVD
jgi:hypothetical protein